MTIIQICETKISLQDGSDLNVGAIDGYGITNLNIAITPKDTNLVFTFWFKNLFDENTPILLAKKSFFGSRRNVFVEPRMIGLTAQYNF